VAVFYLYVFTACPLCKGGEPRGCMGSGKDINGFLLKESIVMKKSAFTLVEIMIVVAIIALLAAIAVPGLLRARLNANDTAAKAALTSVVTAIESYAAATGGYPANTTVLTSANPKYLQVAPSNGSNGYNYDFSGMTTTSYTIAATAATAGTTGTKNYSVSTGAVWTITDAA
jgi:prepilin-type N-terminal cleavage/methylation domain-containing protein